MAVDTQPRPVRPADGPAPIPPRVAWAPGPMVAATFISACVALAVMAPVWMTSRSFGGDWWLHLRLLDQQRIAWQTMQHPTLFTSMDPVGALTPLPMLYGASLNAIGGLLAVAVGTLTAYVVLHVLVTWCAFFGMWWLTGLMGVSGWRRYVPGAALVTSAFFLGDPLGRGGFGEFAATQVLPLCMAGVVDVFVNGRIRLRSALAVALPMPFVLGGHTISTVWTSLLAVVVILSLWAVARGYIRRPGGRSLILLVAVAVCAAATTLWAMAPAVLTAPSLNAGGASFDFGATRYFGNPAIWLNPLRVLPQEHIEFWRPGPESPVAFAGATSLFVQLPVLFLLWAVIVLVRRRHDPAARTSIVFAQALIPPGLLLAALITFPEVWTGMPSVLQSTQYGFRLMSYAQILVAILLGLALRAEERPTATTAGDRSTRGMRAALVAILLLCCAQTVWQGWTTVNITNNRGYDQPRQEALVSPFDAVDWYDATQARAKGDISDPGFFTPTRNTGFTSATMTTWSPARQVPLGTQLRTPVVAPDDLVEWQDAVPIGRTPAGFAIIRTTGPDVTAMVTPTAPMTLAALLSIGAIAVLPLLALGAALEGRRGPVLVITASPRGQPRESFTVPVALALVGVVCVAVAAAVPAQQRVAEQSWSLERDQPVFHVSATGMPRTTTISVPCDSFRDIPLGRSVDLLRTSSTPTAGPGLVLQAQPSRVAFGVDGRTDTWLFAQVLGRDCSVIASYDAQRRSLTLDSGQSTQSSVLPTDPVNGAPLTPSFVNATSDAAAKAGVVVTVRSFPTTIVSGTVRAAALLLAIACGLALLVWARRFSRQVRVLAGPLLHPMDALVAGVLMVAGVLVPAGFDDGWVLSTVRARETLGHFSNLFTGAGAVQPQGAWWNTLQATYSNSLFVDPAVLLRLPEIACCVIAWILLRRLVTCVRGDMDRLSLSLAGATFSAGAVGLMSGIRPEAVVGLLLVCLVILLVAFRRTQSFFYLSGAWLLVGLSIAVHQSGMALLATALASVPAAVQVFRSSENRIRLLLILSPAIILPLAAVLLPGNIPQLLDGLSRFQFSPEYHRQFYELDRWLEVLAVGNTGMNPARRLAPVIGLLVLVAAWWTRKRLSSDGRYLLLLFTLPWLGLVLTASKWAWHFGLVIPGAAAMVLLCAPHWKAAVSGRRGVQIALVGIMALIGFNISQGLLDWTQGFDAPVPVVGGFPFTGPAALSSLWLWLVFFGVGTWCVLRYPRGRAVLGTAVATVALVVAGSLQPVVADAIARPHSWVSQQLQVLSGGRCGLGSMQTAVELAPLPQDDAVDVGATPTTRSDTLFLPVGPADTDAFTSTQRGMSTTPTFFTQPGQGLQGWIQTSGSAVNARVEFVDTYGTLLDSVPVSRRGNEAWWLWQATSPPGARYVRVTWVSAGESVTATEPLRVVATRPVADLPAQTVWNNPQGYFQAACFPPIDISDGVVPPLDLSIGLPQWMGAGWMGINKPVEMACPQRTDVLAANTCVYGFTGRPLVEADS